jgi:hypothetical protein
VTHTVAATANRFTIDDVNALLHDVLHKRNVAAAYGRLQVSAVATRCDAGFSMAAVEVAGMDVGGRRR